MGKKNPEIVGFDNGPNTLKRLTTWRRNNQPDAHLKSGILVCQSFQILTVPTKIVSQ